MTYIIRQKIVDYVNDCNHKYNKFCKKLQWSVSAKRMVNLSLKLSPSITYLDLSTCELTWKKKQVLTWLDWRKLSDSRLEIIYRLDLEDKNQVLKCSKYCLPCLSFRLVYALDSDSFPGYYRLHGWNKSEYFDLSLHLTLNKDIEKYINISCDKEGAIQKILPTIQRFDKWFGIYKVRNLNTFSLKTLCETNTKNFFLIAKLLNYSKTFKVWIYFQVPYLKSILETNKMKRLINPNVQFSGNCGLVLDLLCQKHFLKIEIFICHGLYPLNEQGINILNGSDCVEELPRRLRMHMVKSLPKGFFKYLEKFGYPIHMSNINVLVYIAMYIFKYQEGLQTLMIIWRCIPNVFLAFEDFPQVFKELPDSMRKDLNEIYLWYRKVISAGVKDNQPRLLQHYCRCIIRKRLAENFDLPNGIHELTLPEHLKDYLRLKF